MSTKLCSKCGKPKKLSAFYRHPLTRDGHMEKCKVCVLKYRRELYKRNKLAWHTYLKNNMKLECVKCGYNTCFAALEFHHRDPNEKDFCIGNITGRPLTENRMKEVLKELKKCDMLCGNCHKELHFLEAELKLFK